MGRLEMSDAKPNQTEIVKKTLIDRKPLTSVIAFREHCITRLSSIIERLRKQGYPIITTRQKNNGLASYSLPENWKL